MAAIPAFGLVKALVNDLSPAVHDGEFKIADKISLDVKFIVPPVAIGREGVRIMIL